MAYHQRKIQKGQYGTISKLKEEIEEYEDAVEQNCVIMAQLELSDIFGALQALAEKYDLTMSDLKVMSDITKSSFRDGTRITKE
jgi:hypothetical protein